MIATTNNVTLETIFHEAPKRLHDIFLHYLSSMTTFPLKESMAYTLQTGGKYLRPALIYITGLSFGASWENVDVPAAAVELIHTYSLIHDDLPCMDNADLRRGRATCHKVYGDAMAVLTGDALHTLAMQILSMHPAKLSAAQRVAMMCVLSKACGSFGMAAGQALDMVEMNQSLTSAALLHIYQLKTGALFSACIELGWLASPDQHPTHLSYLHRFADHLGIAFQIQDDILDVEAEPPTSGKSQGIDEQNQKMTYVKIHGLLQAKKEVSARYEQALASLDALGSQGNLLRAFIEKTAHYAFMPK